MDTIREPLLVLDENLRVISANRSFCLVFKMSQCDVQGLPIYGLGDGQWNIPELRLASRFATLDEAKAGRDDLAV